MTTTLLAWRRLILVWLPATLLCLASLGVYFWQGSLGREARLRERVAELEGSLARLEKARADAARDRTDVVAVEAELESTYREVFGTLDGRLVPILRDIGASARSAGMLPASITYSFDKDRHGGTTEFTVSFAVEGTYQQVRTLLGTLQTSSEFLTVKSLSFRGEAEATSNVIGIAVDVGTILAEADPAAIATMTTAAPAAPPTTVEAEAE
jgi:hypothetical protein